LGRDKLKKTTFGVKNDQNSPLKKVDGSWFFWSDFCLFSPKWVAIGFIEKQAPQKALCLGPDPPPGEKSKFIDFWWILSILGSSIEPEKASVKSASTPYPPQKVNFIVFLYLGTRLFVFFNNYHVWVVCWVLYCLLFLDRDCMLSMSFFFVDYLGSFVWFLMGFVFFFPSNPRRVCTFLPSKGPKTGHIRYCLLELCFNYSRPNWSGANIGPRYSLSTLTIGNTNVYLFNLSLPTGIKYLLSL
jgi:hypothetical protein